MALDLEVVGEVREIGEGESAPTGKAVTLKNLRDSHHNVARLVASGMAVEEVSFQTGYTPARIYTLQSQDQMFIDLVTFYRRTARAAQQEVEAHLLGLAQDARQEFHERLLDTPESISNEELLAAMKLAYDRAGFAPVTRTVNKNLNLNIAARLDEARSRALRKDET